jgi:hypothetical protein
LFYKEKELKEPKLKKDILVSKSPLRKHLPISKPSLMQFLDKLDKKKSADTHRKQHIRVGAKKNDTKPFSVMGLSLSMNSIPDRAFTSLSSFPKPLNADLIIKPAAVPFGSKVNRFS